MSCKRILDFLVKHEFWYIPWNYHSPWQNGAWETLLSFFEGLFFKRLFFLGEAIFKELLSTNSNAHALPVGTHVTPPETGGEITTPLRGPHVFFEMAPCHSVFSSPIVKEPHLLYLCSTFFEAGGVPNKCFLTDSRTIPGTVRTDRRNPSPLKASLWLWLPKWHSDRLAQLLSTDRNLSHGREAARANSLIAPKTLKTASLVPCIENSVWWYAFQIEIISCHLPMFAFIYSFFCPRFFCYQLFQVFQFLKIRFTYHAYCDSTMSDALLTYAIEVLSLHHLVFCMF